MTRLDPFAGDEPFARVCTDIRAGRVRALPRQSDRHREGQRAFTDVWRYSFGDEPPPPCINATALYRDLVDQDDPIDLYGDHPDMRPPWEQALIGYVNEHGNAVVLVTSSHRLQPGDPTPWWVEEYQPDCEVDRIEWVVNGNIVVGGRGANGPTPTTGPLAGLWLVVYDDGTLGDIHWMDYTRPGEVERQDERDSVPQQWDMALLVWMGTIKMANCANVELDDSQPHRAARRRIARTGTVVSRLVLREGGRRRSGGSTGGSFTTALTSVRGHVCVDEATEILTANGWSTHDKLNVGDCVASMDVATGRGAWVPVEQVHRSHYSGPMVSVERKADRSHGASLSMLLTPNHRCVVGRRHEPSDLSMVRADALLSSHVIPQALELPGAGPGLGGTDVAALMGWVAAEGHYCADSVYLAQSSTANPENVALIDRLMADLPIPQWLRDRSNIQRRVLRWNRTVEPDGMVRWRLPLGLSQLVTRTMPGKLIPAWFVRLPAEERAAFLDAFIRGDGCVRGDRCVIGQRSEANINALQSIIASLGQASGKYVEHRTDGDMHFASVRQVAFRGLRAANGGPPVGVGAQQYDGMVWCPTTPTGTWVARRNGTVFVTGNSHYGACCDTHPPRGLLFGKYTRKVWVPQHARGDVDTGVVEQTFVTAGSDR